MQTTSPDIYPLISTNNGKLWETTWSFIQSEVRPEPKLNTPRHFWRLYLDAGVWFHFPCELILHTRLLRYFLLFILAFFPQTSLITEHSSQNCLVVSFGLLRNTTLKCEYLKNQTYTSRLFFCLCWGLVVVGFLVFWFWFFFCKPTWLFNTVGIHLLLPFLCSYMHLPFVIPNILFTLAS